LRQQHEWKAPREKVIKAEWTGPRKRVDFELVAEWDVQ